MVGWDGVKWAAGKAWQFFGWLLDLREARDIITAYSIGVIVGDPVATVVSALRDVPDVVFWPVFFLTTFLVARAVAWGISRSGDKPPASVELPRIAASASGPDSTAVAAGNNAPGGTMLTFGNRNAIVITSSGDDHQAISAALGAVKRIAATSGESRADILLALADIRQRGVDLRNALIFARGSNAKERVSAAYNEWLSAAVEEVRRISEHEARAFRLLGTFRFDTAPDGNYQEPVIRWLIAMFSTHLDKIEEIRKRYSTLD